MRVHNCVYSSDQLNQILNKCRTAGCQSHKPDSEDGAESLSHLCSERKTAVFLWQGSRPVFSAAAAR